MENVQHTKPLNQQWILIHKNFRFVAFDFVSCNLIKKTFHFSIFHSIPQNTAEIIENKSQMHSSKMY